LPHGYEKEVPIAFKKPDGSLGEPLGKYQRINTTVRDPFTIFDMQQHGLTIERIQLTYSPFEWLNILAGRFLTPYGIWNVDHGSPVVLTSRLPYLQQRMMMPLAQTGIDLFGRIFPLDRLLFDFGLTLSNGRGPLDALLDLDENKALGLRQRLVYSGDDFTLSLGAYEYFGAYTDIQKLNVADPKDGTFNSLKVISESYDEAVFSLDLQLRYQGLTLQAEYVQRWVWYDVSSEIGNEFTSSKGINPLAGETHYWPNFVGQGTYGLVAYELPLRRWLGQLPLIPYLFVEYMQEKDTLPYQKGLFCIGGLNLRPSQYIVLKLEANILVELNRNGKAAMGYKAAM
jgi:hypothetical protein